MAAWSEKDEANLCNVLETIKNLKKEINDFQALFTTPQTALGQPTFVALNHRLIALETRRKILEARKERLVGHVAPVGLHSLKVQKLENEKLEVAELPFCGLLPNQALLLARESCLEKIKSFLNWTRTSPFEYEPMIFLISSPSGSGKTTILQYLYDNKAFIDPTVETYYYAAFNQSEDPFETLKEFCDQTFTLIPPYASVQKVILLLDDAQNSYDCIGFWECLRGSSFPRNLKIIISTTFAATLGDSSPVSLSTISGLRRNDLLLSLADSKAMIEEGLFWEPKWSHCKTLVEVIARDCNGLAGALQIAIHRMSAFGSQTEMIVESEAIQEYLSASEAYERCFGNLKEHLPDIRETVMHSALHGFIEVTPTTRLMHRGGLLEYPSMMVFTSSLARRFVHWNLLNVGRVQSNPTSLLELIKRSIESMSSSLLRTSKDAEFPQEGAFQHLFMAALARNTSIDTCVCSDLSHIFPCDAHDKGDPSKIRREMDFFIGGDLRWGIQLLVCDCEATEHVNRFVETGKYARLNCRDYCIVEFRSRNPSIVNCHSNQVTAVFPTKDFATCTIKYGMQKEILQLEA